MNIDTFAYEYDGLSEKRKSEGLENIFKYILKDIEGNYGIIEEILNTCVALEADDYFGTEGANI